MITKYVKFLIVLAAICILVSIALIFVVLQPALDATFDLSGSKSANIATTIGGIVGPAMSFVSSVLLLFALLKQIESNNDQKSRNEIDILFMLFNQLEREYANYSVASNHPKNGPTTYYGYHAFFNFCSLFADPQIGRSFGDKNDANHILNIISSFEIIKSKIQLSYIPSGTRDIITDLVEKFYRYKLRDPLANLAFGIKDNSDQVSKRVCGFFQSMEREKDPDFVLKSVNKLEDLF